MSVGPRTGLDILETGRKFALFCTSQEILRSNWKMTGLCSRMLNNNKIIIIIIIIEDVAIPGDRSREDFKI